MGCRPDRMRELQVQKIEGNRFVSTNVRNSRRGVRTYINTLGREKRLRSTMIRTRGIAKNPNRTCGRIIKDRSFPATMELLR